MKFSKMRVEKRLFCLDTKKNWGGKSYEYPLVYLPFRESFAMIKPQRPINNVDLWKSQ